MKQWYVLYVFSRKEKKILETLSRSGFEAYLPLMKLRKQWSDRKKWVEEPLFKGYLFVFTDKTGLQECLSIPGVLFVIKQEGHPAVIREEVIRNIQITLTHPEYLTVSSEIFFPGQQVRVTEGPFTGFQGTIVRSAGKTRLMVAIDQLGKSITLEVPAGMLIEYLPV